MQQAGGRCGVEQVAAALLEHVRDHVLGGEDLGHHVDVEDLLPLLGGCLDAAVDGDPGVGDEQVDPPEAVDGGRDEVRDVLFAADVGRYREGADRGGPALAGLLV